MATGYLTPNSIPTGITCRSLFIPDDEQFIANVRGLLQTFTFPETFVQQGALTPQQTADAYVAMFDDFCFNRGPCKLIGEIVIWSGVANPHPGAWLPCDGSSIERAIYTELFDAIGTTYGSVDGTHFSLPDLRGRVPVGTGQGSGLTDRVLGTNYGEENHTLITSEMPSHAHSDAGHSHTEITALPNLTTIGPGVPEPTAVPGIGFTGTGFANISNTGGSGSHNNMQPSLTLTYLIVALDA